MRILKPLFVFVATFFAFNSFAYNPNFRLQTARWSAINKTEIGKYYSNIYGSDLLLMNGALSSEVEIRTVEGKKTILVHADLASSDFHYLSWILFQGFVRYSLVVNGADLGTDESEVFVWRESMRYLDELETEEGVVVSTDIDFTYNPQFNYGRKRQLSISKFHLLWREDPLSFDLEVLRRKRDLDRISSKE